MQLVERHDDRAGLQCRSPVIDACDGEGRALNGKGIAGLLMEAVGEKFAQHHFGLPIAKAAAGEKRKRIELIGIGPPAIDERIHVRREIHQVEDHGRSLGHVRKSADFGA